jgi:hypothetical protein
MYVLARAGRSVHSLGGEPMACCAGGKDGSDPSGPPRDQQFSVDDMRHLEGCSSDNR